MATKKPAKGDAMELEVTETDYEGNPIGGAETEEINFAQPPKPTEPRSLDIQEFTAGCLYCDSVVSRRTQEDADAWLDEHLQICPTKALSELCDIATQALEDIQNGVKSDNYNLSALQFQVAMLQPCNGQILPAAVRDEIDRLYAIEKKYAVAELAHRVLVRIVEHEPILVTIPEGPDDRLIMLAILNRWYSKAYPDRDPLKLSSSQSS